jgi:hypothetical protein
MKRFRGVALSAAVLASATGWLVAPPPAAATQVVVVDHAVHTTSFESPECPPPSPFPNGPSCGGLKAIGVTVDGPRVWNLTMTVSWWSRGVIYPLCTGGSWRLEAADGSGDALAGRLLGQSREDCLWEVNSGAGAYLGATDAAPGGTAQSFRLRYAPYNPVTGITQICWCGGLRFTLA